MPSNAFYTNSRFKLLTYAQCDGLDPADVVHLLDRLGAECIIGREHHEDGGIHLHVFADFGRKFRSRKADVFDVHEWHPNITSSWGTPEKGWDYAVKDDDIVGGQLERPRVGRGCDGTSAVSWSEVADSESAEEFWRLCRACDPKTFVTRVVDLQRFADRKFGSVPVHYEHPRAIRFVGGDTDGRDNWLRQSLIGLEQPFVGTFLPTAWCEEGPRRQHPASLLLLAVTSGLASRPDRSSPLLSRKGFFLFVVC